jgi:hypothetical protein
VSGRSRVLAYGAAGLLVVAGIVCAAAVPGETGQVLAAVLIGSGLVGFVGLVFLEVGLSEDHERERERRRVERLKQTEHPARRPGGPMRWRRRP